MLNFYTYPGSTNPKYQLFFAIVPFEKQKSFCVYEIQNTDPQQY